MYSSLHVCNITCTSPRAYTQREHETASNGTGGLIYINNWKLAHDITKATTLPSANTFISEAQTQLCMYMYMYMYMYMCRLVSACGACTICDSLSVPSSDLSLALL